MLLSFVLIQSIRTLTGRLKRPFGLWLLYCWQILAITFFIMSPKLSLKLSNIIKHDFFFSDIKLSPFCQTYILLFHLFSTQMSKIKIFVAISTILKTQLDISKCKQNHCTLLRWLYNAHAKVNQQLAAPHKDVLTLINFTAQRSFE